MSDAISGRIPPKFQGFSARKEQWLKAILEDDALPRNAYRVAAAIAGFLNHKTGACWPSVATLAKLARYVDRTIQRLLSALEARGYLKIERRSGAFGCNVYSMIVAGEIAEGGALAQSDDTTPAAPKSDKIPELQWIALDAPEWPDAAQHYREEHRRAPPIDKRGGWWFKKSFAKSKVFVSRPL